MHGQGYLFRGQCKCSLGCSVKEQTHISEDLTDTLKHSFVLTVEHGYREHIYDELMLIYSKLSFIP